HLPPGVPQMLAAPALRAPPQVCQRRAHWHTWPPRQARRPGEPHPHGTSAARNHQCTANARRARTGSDRRLAPPRPDRPRPPAIQTEPPARPARPSSNIISEDTVVNKDLLLQYLECRRKPPTRTPEAVPLHAALCEAAPAFYLRLLADPVADVGHKREALAN